MTMPNPRRFARRSIAFLQRLGLPKDKARELVAEVAMDAYNTCSDYGPGNWSWLLRVAGHALTDGVVGPTNPTSLPGRTSDTDQP